MKHELKEIPYPPAPWVSDGQMWTGVYPVKSPPALPEGLMPFLDPRWVVLVFVRYLEGTLGYDELVIGSLARRGLKFGIYVHHIWVDSEASVWGGRRIWGLPKELASFAWDGDTVSVTDDERLIATLSVDRSDAASPRVGTIAPGFGRLDGRWIYTKGSVRGRPGASGMNVTAWSSRFPYRIEGRPRFGMGLRPMHIMVPAPVVIG